MRHLCLLLFLLIVFSCKKDEQKAELPPVTCSDTTDDGIFEHWNEAEQNIMLKAFQPIIEPDSVVPGYVKRIDSMSRSISLASHQFTFRASYDTGVVTELNFYLVDNFYGLEATGRTRVDWTEKNKTVAERCVLNDPSNGPPPVRPMTRGCKRLYYFAFAPAYYRSNAQAPTGTVVFKGHYDVEVN